MSRDSPTLFDRPLFYLVDTDFIHDKGLVMFVSVAGFEPQTIYLRLQSKSATHYTTPGCCSGKQICFASRGSGFKSYHHRKVHHKLINQNRPFHYF